MEPNEDRLTKLPDNIVHNILELSCLPIFDLVELGFSSRRWNHLLITMPYLDIRTNLSYSLHPVGIPFNHAFIENITRFITRLLIRQGQSRLVRFSLLSRTLDFDSVQILMWLCLVAGRYVQELDIEFHPSRDFRLPLCVAVNDSLIVLRIALVDKVLQLLSVVRLNRLRSLELYEVAFADSDLLQRLFSGCPALESLSLKDCVAGRFSFLDFSSTYLKELIFDFHHDEIDDFSNFVIKVSCPNLVFFQYSAPIAMRYILEDVYSLKTAFIGVSVWLAEVFLDHSLTVGLSVSRVKDVQVKCFKC
ncbi:hypothetical protein LIER_25287 [Lithospermum erythrorhizon]|uniref:F-box/LRR-repeat protein 15/At3g58940/PEG3-like LRR domain-containing protein n=1 Tax=Lithospermum erythrorhizon TaxID=34254 RepID=A0AAV3R780_LITER